jgi:hypothetical protein
VIDNGFSVILGGKIEPILVHIPPNPLITGVLILHDGKRY